MGSRVSCAFTVVFKGSAEGAGRTFASASETVSLYPEMRLRDAMHTHVFNAMMTSVGPLYLCEGHTGVNECTHRAICNAAVLTPSFGIFLILKSIFSPCLCSVCQENAMFMF